jgi:Ca2+-binding EF-hand superfamily protein
MVASSTIARQSIEVIRRVLRPDVPAIAEAMISLSTIPLRTALASLALLSIGTLVPALAADPAPAPTGGAVAFQEEFKRADVNKDGKLSEEEAVAAGFFTDGSFKDVDEDKNGTVTLFELGDALQQRLRQWTSDGERADTDKDGYVSEDEAEAAGPSFLDIFKRANRDGDGRIARDKFDVYVRESYYSETSDRGVVPNIIEKRF